MLYPKDTDLTLAMGGHGQQHCLICGGPANWEQWQDSHVGVTEDDVPIELSNYEEDYGAFKINTTPFQINTTLSEAESLQVGSFGELRDGLTCHRSCYQLLYSRLGYMLVIDDVVPLLLYDSERYGPWGGSLSTNSLLSSEYGRLENSLDQVLARSYLLGWSNVLHLSAHRPAAVYNCVQLKLVILFSLPC